MTPEEIAGEYELETGKVHCGGLPRKKPRGHARGAGPQPRALHPGGMTPKTRCTTPWCWRSLPLWAWHDLMLNPHLPPMQQELLDKHYLRKHGANAYYGQKGVE